MDSSETKQILTSPSKQRRPRKVVSLESLGPSGNAVRVNVGEGNPVAEERTVLVELDKKGEKRTF